VTSSETAAPVPGPPRAPSRVGAALGGTRELARIAYRDPEHVAERLTLHAIDRLGEPSREWALARQGAGEAAARRYAEEMCRESAFAARIDGAVAGTPFLIALVPGYLAYLWQEGRMVLRLAALYGRDPRALSTAAEMLVLRGIHPTRAEAEQALDLVRTQPVPPRAGRRRPLATWARSVYRLLIFGGFLSPPEHDHPAHHRLRQVIAAVAGGVIWVITWVLPVTFMIAMAWGCESHTRDLGRRALAFYDPGDATGKPQAAPLDAQGRLRRAVRATLLFLSVAVPIAFVAYVNHVRQTVGVNWLGALGALVALSLVVATSVRASRR
jgi:hypothetical protein